MIGFSHIDLLPVRIAAMSLDIAMPKFPNKTAYIISLSFLFYLPIIL
jgi:hypothetical protein